MKSCPFHTPRAFAEIDTAALADNFRAVRAACGRTIAVVKANAYGHGLFLAVPAFLSAGCEFFAVASIDEALAVRALAPRADILILGYTPPTQAPLLVREHLTQTVFSAPFAAALSQAATAPVSVHLKIDGGMCRLGFDPADRAGLSFALGAKNLAVCGLFTHLPVADCEPVATNAALARFFALRAALPHLFAHAAATSALSLEAARFDAVRPGLALYGFAPNTSALSLRPAMRVFAPIVQLRRVRAGTPVGYGGAFVAARDCVIGTLPMGYADGLARGTLGHTVTLYRDGAEKKAPVVGHICMDHCMVDFTDVPVKEGDTVCVISDFSAVAARRGSIVYEALTDVSSRVVRQQKGVVT